MIGMAAEGYAMDNGQYPSSAEALREYWPELPGEVVFTLEEAIPSMLRLSADPAETPYVWLAQVRQEDAANHLVALKRVDRGEARGTIVLLFGDMSVRYVKAEELAAELRSLSKATALPSPTAPPASSASPE